LVNVRTYIQSGNVFFESDEEERAGLTGMIERHLQEALGYAVPVCLRTVGELERVVALDPFREKAVTPEMRLCVVFAAAPLAEGLALPLWSPRRDVEIVQATRGEAFVVWYLNNGRPPAADAFLASTLGSQVTTRFYHTTAKLLAAAKG
ncbi:MAG TPA: DUF1697 domain-containing protein, partial [Ktedonobacterales bacterium]